MSFGKFGLKTVRTPSTPKPHGKKPFSSRTVIGVVCIVMALLITFGVAPLVNRFTDQKIEIIRVKSDIVRGQLITANDIEMVTVGSYNLPDKVMRDKKEVIGKYAAANLYAGDYLFLDKLSTDNKSAEDVLSALDGKKVAISVKIADFAAGLSDKLENGDIVSVIIFDKDNNISYTPASLQYVKVITTTTSDGIDKDQNIEGGKSATVTLLATPEQAELLAHYNSTTTVHFSLVYRGESKQSDAYIKAQDDYLMKNPIENKPIVEEEDDNG